MATYENRMKMQYLMRYINSKRRARAILNEIKSCKVFPREVEKDA